MSKHPAGYVAPVTAREAQAYGREAAAADRAVNYEEGRMEGFPDDAVTIPDDQRTRIEADDWPTATEPEIPDARPMTPDDPRGLKALAERLPLTTWPPAYTEREKARDVHDRLDIAAAILGERAVFLPDGLDLDPLAEFFEKWGSHSGACCTFDAVGHVIVTEASCTCDPLTKRARAVLTLLRSTSPATHPFKDEWSFQRSMSRGNPMAGKPIAPEQPCFACGVPFGEHGLRPASPEPRP